MSDLAIAPAPEQNAGVAALARLTDRIARLVPPPAAQPLLLQPSQVVARGLAKSRAARSRSMAAMAAEGFTAACSFIPYALVALGLRLVMARIFFIDGQTKIAGPELPLDLHGFHFSMVLPAQVKAETFTAFMTQFAPLPVPPVPAAYMVSYAEFFLPLMLMLGFGTRIAALGLLIMTAVIQIYIMPEHLWITQIYWFAILTVLLSQGAGQISADHAIRILNRHASRRA
jgi:putative oxidoreductase